MKKNIAYSVVVFILLACWILFGALTQLIMGVLKWSELPFILGVAIGVSAVLTLIFYFIFAKVREKIGSKKENESEYKPSRMFLNVAVFLVAAVSITSVMQSYSIGKEKNDIAENQEKAANKQRLAALARAETEKQRLASMTPEQRAAAEAQKQEKIAEAAKVAVAAAAMSAKEQEAAARKENIQKLFSAWDGSHRGLEKIIKDAMNDPDSYKHVETVYWDMGDHLVVKTTYRGKNAFGGVVKNWVKAKIGLDGKVLEIIEQGT